MDGHEVRAAEVRPPDPGYWNVPIRSITPSVRGTAGGPTAGLGRPSQLSKPLSRPMTADRTRSCGVVVFLMGTQQQRQDEAQPY